MHVLVFVGLLAFCLGATTYLLKTQDVAMAAAVAVLGLSVIAQQGRRFSWGGSTGLLLLLYGMLVALSVPTSMWLGRSIESVQTLGKLMVIFLVSVNAVTTRRRIHWLFAILVVMVLLFPGVGGLIYYFTGSSREVGRATWRGWFGNSNYLALTMLMFLPYVAAFFAQTRKLPLKLLWGTGITLMLVLTVLTKSRAGFLAMIALALGLMMLSRRRVQVLGAVVAVVLAVAILAPPDFKERMTTIFASEETRGGSANDRVVIWGIAIDLALTHPLTGVGVGTYDRANAEHPRARLDLGEAGGERYMDTHNSFLNIWAEIGTPGLIVFVAALVMLLRQSLRTIRWAPPNDLLTTFVRAGAVSFGVFIVMGLFNTFHRAWFFYMLFAVQLSMIRILEKECSLNGRRRGKRNVSPTRARRAVPVPLSTSTLVSFPTGDQVT